MAKDAAVTEDELAGLSEEERAALADDEESTDDELDEDETDDDEGEDDGEDESGDDDDEESGEDDKAGKPDGDPADPATADDAADAGVLEDDDDDEAPTLYKVDPVEKFDEQIAAFADEKKALRDKLNNGDLTLDEYETAKDAVVAKEQALREQQLKATMFEEQNRQNAVANWNKLQDKFFKAEANKIYSSNKLLMTALDTTVKELANDAANSDKPAKWFLQEADRRVREAFGHTGKPPVEQEKPVNPKDKAAKARKPNLAKVPKTLANLPAAEQPETSGDEFAGLENLSGMDLEREIARRSKTDPTFERRYLQGL